MSSTVTTINPATGEKIKQYEFMSKAAVEEAVVDSVEAFSHWRKVPLATRTECVRVFAEALTAGRVALGELMTQEMGKPMAQSLAEIDKCVASANFLRENYPKWKEALEYTLPTGYGVTHEPMGALVAVMPWNYPLWQVTRFAIPALLSGNSILLKHSTNTWGSAEFIEEIFKQAFPDGLYQNLRVDHDVIETLIADRRIKGVSLTGSRRAGVSVGAAAGKNLKKCVLELGGSDAYVVLDDADLDVAVKACVAGRMVNTGQSCVAAKRFIVTKKNIAAFTEKFVAGMKAFTDVGPMARVDLRDELHKQVLESVKKGAKLALGGELPKGPGAFYPPSVLTGVKPGMPAFDDELFGPVAAVIEAADETEAIRFANQSIYGLGGAIFSKDVKRALELARVEFDSGMVFINDFVKSDASAPFGGTKDSGLGRELGREGSFEFTNIRMTYAKP